jgi:hypothetical protein
MRRVTIALLLAGSMLFYVERVLVPYQQRDSAATGRPRGNLSDLYPRWLGARELLLNGRDPYSAEVTRDIQTGYYGRPLEAGRASDPADQQGFAYPVFVVFLLAPTITLSFPLVQSGFYWLLFLVTAASVFLWFSFLRWRPSRELFLTVLLLTAGSFPLAQGIKLQQLTLLVGGLIALSAALLSRGHLASAGMLTAFAAIKPQLAVPMAGWLALWSFGDWKHRRRYVLGFGLTLGALLLASEWVLPGWMARFRDAVAAYRAYTGGAGSLLDTLMNPAWGRLTALLIVGIVFMMCWRTRRASSFESRFIMMTSLVLTATVVIVPMIAPYNQLLLLPAVLILVRQWPELLKEGLPVRALAWGAAVLLAWPWVATAALTLLSLFLAPEQAQRFWPAPLVTSLFIPLWVFALQLVAWSKAALSEEGIRPANPAAGRAAAIAAQPE